MHVEEHEGGREMQINSGLAQSCMSGMSRRYLSPGLPPPSLTAARCRIWLWHLSRSHLRHMLFCMLVSVQCGGDARLG